MGYVEQNLLPSEEIVYKAKIHWIIYLNAIILIGLGIFLINTSPKNTESNGFAIIGGLIIFVGISSFIKAYIDKNSTELVVTTNRIIAKFGFIKRDTIELNHNKVESLLVQQSSIQRLLNAGTIIIQGTGGGKTPIPNIDNPLEFRKNAMEIIDKRVNQD